jgi:hypothetical protein
MVTPVYPHRRILSSGFWVLGIPAAGNRPCKGAVLLLAKVDLLVLDDFGLQPLNQEQRHDLLEILEDRYQLRSTLVAGQLPHEHWHEQIGDPTLADAILDRLIHNAHIIQLKGGSMRKAKAGLTAVKREEEETMITASLRSDYGVSGITGIRR